MGALTTQAIVTDIVSEFNGSGTTSPWTLFNVGGVTSGQIFDKITEANAALQGWVGLGSVTPTDAAQKEAVKRFEVSYGSARLAADLIGVVITDGYNVQLAGLGVNRTQAEFSTYVQFIKDHMDTAKWYIKMLHQWFWVFAPDTFQGWTETGTPVTYWNVSQGRMTG